MATLGELRTRVKGHLRRQDCTDAQADEFLRNAIRRSQRVLRVPALERFLLHDVGVTDGQPIPGFEQTDVYVVDVPGDFLEIINFRVNDKHIRRVGLREFGLQYRAQVEPAIFAREQNTWLIAKGPAQADQVNILYYADVSAFVDDNDENEISAFAPDLLMWGACAIGGDFFRIDHRVEWEAKYQAELEAIQAQARAQEMGELKQVQPQYGPAMDEWYAFEQEY